MDLGAMRTVVRRELRDEDASGYRWPDDELDRHISRAVRELSEAVPLEVKVTATTTAGSRDIDIASLTGRVMVEAVEFPVDRFPRMYQRFSLWGDTLTLLGSEVPDGSGCHIYYGKLHTLDAAGSTIPARHEDLVAAGTAGYAALGWAAYAINRVNTGGAASPGDFLTWGRERLRFFHDELKRLGRRHRVRVRALYRPCQPSVSSSTGPGP